MCVFFYWQGLPKLSKLQAPHTCLSALSLGKQRVCWAWEDVTALRTPSVWLVGRLPLRPFRFWRLLRWLHYVFSTVWVLLVLVYKFKINSTTITTILKITNRVLLEHWDLKLAFLFRKSLFMMQGPESSPRPCELQSVREIDLEWALGSKTVVLTKWGGGKKGKKPPVKEIGNLTLAILKSYLFGFSSGGNKIKCYSYKCKLFSPTISQNVFFCLFFFKVVVIVKSINKKNIKNQKEK